MLSFFPKYINIENALGFPNNRVVSFKLFFSQLNVEINQHGHVSIKLHLYEIPFSQWDIVCRLCNVMVNPIVQHSAFNGIVVRKTFSMKGNVYQNTILLFYSSIVLSKLAAAVALLYSQVLLPGSHWPHVAMQHLKHGNRVNGLNL